MDFELWDKQVPDVSFTKANIAFPAFDFYKEKVEMIAEYINGIELTDDNVKEVKGILADARKLTDGLNRKRIDIKNEILAGFSDFESQIKELSKIVGDAEGQLREKVKEIDEQEREEKKEKIREIWAKRIGTYQIYDLLPNAFEVWLTPQMLNKSTSLKAAETDMVEWLEDTEKAICTLQMMDDEYLVEYLGCLDLADAVASVNSRREIQARVRESDEDDEEKAIFIIKGKKDIKLTEHLLKENEINYTKN